MDYIPVEVDVPKFNIATFAIAVAICYKRNPLLATCDSNQFLFDKVKQKEESWTLNLKNMNNKKLHIQIANV